MTLNFKLCAAGGVVAVLLLLTGCGRHDPPKAESRGCDRVIAVEVAQVRHTPVSVTRVYSGSLEGVEQASIVPKLSERITAIAVRVGQRVQAGSKILSLDKGGTSSQYYQALATCENARKTVERMQSLYHEGAIALQSLDGAQTAYAVAKANFEGARSAVELTSPIAGEVTAVSASLGDLSVPGAALATVARIDQMKVTFNMNESDVAALASAQKVRVYSEVQPDARAEGAVFQIAKSADVRSRSFEVKALFANTRDRWFKPGMFVKVTFTLTSPPNVLTVPNAAIQTDGEQSRVFRVRCGRACAVHIIAGVTDGEQTVVLDGLADGDTVATVGINNLRDSSFVNVVPR